MFVVDFLRTCRENSQICKYNQTFKEFIKKRASNTKNTNVNLTMLGRNNCLFALYGMLPHHWLEKHSQQCYYMKRYMLECRCDPNNITIVQTFCGTHPHTPKNYSSIPVNRFFNLIQTLKKPVNLLGSRL